MTADEFYDMLSAKERLLEDSRRAERQAATPPPNAHLRERYLRQAVRWWFAGIAVDNGGGVAAK